jgi:hypothetical protein
MKIVTAKVSTFDGTIIQNMLLLINYILLVNKMSFQPDVSQALNKLWNSQIRSQREPASIIVPLQPRQYTTNDEDNGANRIFMDHSNLPPMAETELYDHSAMTHNLMNEFAYECYGQQESGAFHLLGAPGLFTVGFRRVAATINQYGNYLDADEFAYQIRHSQFSSNANGQWTEQVVTKTKANQPVQLFMSSNDRFFVESDWGNMTLSNDHYWMQSNNHLVITRLSRNPYYTSSHEPYLD